MITPHAAVAAKAVLKGAVVLAAVEIAAYEISPESFSLVAVGVGALTVAVVGFIGLILTAHSNRKNREQLAKIATDQAAALAVANAANAHLQTLEIRMDGRMDKLLSSVAEISEATGVRKGLQQAADTAAGKAEATAHRDSVIVDKVAEVVAERIGAAADAAAQTMPAATAPAPAAQRAPLPVSDEKTAAAVGLVVDAIKEATASQTK